MERMLSLLRRLIPRSLFRALQPMYHLVLAVSGNLVYRFPTRGMIVVAVTGTNGKTTTALIAAELLKSAGHRVGLSSTTTFEVAGEVWPNTTNRTNLGRWQFARLASRMRRAGCTHLVVEASSQGIAMHRLWGVPVDVAVFTNLTPDHLDYHGTMEAYREAKEQIFVTLTRSRRLPGVVKTAIVNVDDPASSCFLAYSADRRVTFSLQRDADLTAREVSLAGTQSEFLLKAEGKERSIRLALPGRYNISNALAAVAVARALGVPWTKIEERLAQPITTPGRLEDIPTGRDFRVVVDYAHSEDALQKLYEALREQTKGRLIAVLGAAGDRDREKRPVLGRVAAERCDVVIVTDEEPYHEDPASIIEAVAKGAREARPDGEDLLVVPDRRKAIGEALRRADTGDIVVVTGMGHQRYKAVGDHKIPWRDQDVIKEELEKL